MIYCIPTAKGAAGFYILNERRELFSSVKEIRRYIIEHDCMHKERENNEKNSIL